MNAAQRATRNEQALELHLAGASYTRIASALGLSSKAVAQKAVEAALASRLGDADVNEATQAEIARLDAMLVGLWPTARKGDVAAVDRVVKIGQRRAALLRSADYDQSVREAYDLSAESSKQVIPTLDAALIATGRKIADRIDEATATGEGQEVTKALYLVPHMVNILREMLATPASRAAMKNAGQGSGQAAGALAQLRSIHGTGQRRGA